MTAIAIYLLKMLVCSGILCGYYYASLQNKLFHQWNRFFLLLTVIFSIIFPLLHIPVFDFSNTSNAAAQIVYKVSASELLLLKDQPQTLSFLELVVYGSYSLVVLVFILLFIVSLCKIFILKRRSTFIQQSEINIYQTNASQAPFSFFKNIFWKQCIDLYSTEGKQILKHELVHVHEKHSVDKVFMQLVLSIFWINPFFWLIKKELTIIHEFIADKKSVENNDASVLASLILTTAYSSGRFNITNHFFQSSIKRRITMITTNKNPRFSYIRRIAALFVLLATLGMVAFRSKNINDPGIASSGKDTSANPKKALELDWFKDADTSTIIYTIDKKRAKYADVRDLTTEQVESVHSYVEKRNGNNVIMIDLVLVDPKRKGSVPMISSNPVYYIDGKETELADLDKLGPDVKSFTVKTWKGEDAIKKFGDQGKRGVIEITTKQANPKNLKEEGAVKPAVNDTVPKADAAKLLHAVERDEIDTTKMTFKLNGREIFASSLAKIPSNTVAIVIRCDGSGAVYPKTNKKGPVMDIITTDKVNGPNHPGPGTPLYIIDGKEVTKSYVDALNPIEIDSVYIWKDARAIQKFGEKGISGVVVVKTKKNI